VFNESAFAPVHVAFRISDVLRRSELMRLPLHVLFR
jgi:hypothetical protein